MKSDRKTALVKSPLRLRPRRVIRSPMRTPASSNKSRMRNVQNSCGIRTEYRTISCEMKTLERMVQEELGKRCSNGVGSSSIGGRDVFERGRLYDVYTARRNERLRSKLLGGEKEKEEEEPKTALNLGVKLSSTKKERATSTKKSRLQAASLSADRSEHPRYALRSMKKPPLPLPINNAAAPASNTKRNHRIT